MQGRRQLADAMLTVPTSTVESELRSPPKRRGLGFSLSTKTLLGLAVSFALGCWILYLANALLLRPRFERLEDTLLERDCTRARMAIQDLATTLTSKVGDWSLWDDTYQFVVDHDPAYVEANLNPESLETLALDFMAFVDTAGQVVHLALRDADAAIDAASVSALLARSPQLLRHADPKSSRAGLLSFGASLLVLAARPIHRSDLSGESHGTLLAGRLFDDDAVAELAHLVRMDLELDRTPCDGEAMHVLRLPERLIAHLPLTAMSGEPLGTLVVRQPREVNQQGEEALSLLLVALLASGALGLLTTLVSIDYVVLARLRRLRTTMTEITRTGDLSRQAETLGHDEIAALSEAFNQLTARLRLTQQDLLRADRARNQFLANVSHEVRTPVTALLGFVDLLQDPDLPRELHDDHVRTIRRNAQHLLTILNDLLDSAKVDSGQMTVELLPTELRPLLEDAVDLVRPVAQQKQLGVSLVTKGTLPAVIRTDPTRLRQILGNLLGNAVKFTERGSVRLEAEMSGSQCLRLSVIDTGIGVTPDQQLRLFMPFAQADATTQRRFGGTGLGLALSRHLARQLGGDVTLSSEAGRGSTFEVVIATGDPELAAREAAQLAAAQQRETPTQPAAARPDHLPLQGDRILVADDAKDNARLVSFVLGKAGASVDVVENGQLAVERCASAAELGRPYDLIVMDMQMPVLDGYAATAQLRRSGLVTPILALTANALKSDLEACLEAGCNDYATKPIDGRSLVRHIAALLQQQSAPIG